MKKSIKTLVIMTMVLTLILGSIAAASAVPYYDLDTGKVYTAEMLKPGNPAREELRGLAPDKIGINIKGKSYSYNNLVDKLAEVFGIGGIEEIRNFFADTENLEEFEVEVPDDELKGLEISAIDKTITLNVAVFEAAEDAKANLAIFAVDKDGEKTGSALVSKTGIEIKDNKVVFDLSSKADFGDKDYVVTVKIGDVEETVNATVKFDAVEKLVGKINNATAAQLSTLLNNAEYFTGFDIAKVDAYKANVEATYAVAGTPPGTLKTVAEVQEKVIDAAEVGAEFDAFVDEINEAKGVFAKYTLLKETFKYVDDANMDDYMSENDATGLFKATTNQGDFNKGVFGDFEKVQDEIDQINLDAVVDGVNGIAFASIAGSAPSKLNAYKADLEALELANAKTKYNSANSKADILEAIGNELKAIDTAREKADKEIVKAEAVLDAFVAANGEVPDEGDVTAYDDVVAAIEALQKEDLKATDLATATLEGKVTALEAATLELTIISDTLAAVDEFEAAFKVNNDTDFKDENVYKAIFVDTSNENSTPILVETSPGSGEYKFGNDGSDDYTSAALITGDPATGPLVDLRTATAEWVVYNAAIATKDAAEMRTLLFDLQPASEFTNLTPNAAKAEFAQYVIDELAEEATAPENFTALQGKIFTSGYLAAYTGKISAVNDASNIAAMITALEAISEDYDKLGAEAKADIAGDVFEVKADLKTFADIVAAMGL